MTLPTLIAALTTSTAKRDWPAAHAALSQTLATRGGVADVRAWRDAAGWSLLHYAVWAGAPVDFVKPLADAMGPDAVDEKTTLGNAAAHMALASQAVSSELVIWVLSKSKDLKARNAAGESMLQIAKSNRFVSPELLEYISEQLDAATDDGASSVSSHSGKPPQPTRRQVSWGEYSAVVAPPAGESEPLLRSSSSAAGGAGANGATTRPASTSFLTRLWARCCNVEDDTS